MPEPPPRHSWRPRLSFAGVVSSILALAALLGFIRIEPQRGAPPARRSTTGNPDRRLPPLALLELGSGSERDDGAVPFLRLAPDAGRAEVSFFPRGASLAATVRIEDDAGRSIVPPASLPHPDALGRATLFVPAEALRRSGRYALVLSRGGAAGLRVPGGPASIEDRYPFRIEAGFAAAAATR